MATLKYQMNKAQFE